jgi:hypothetical protein
MIVLRDAACQFVLFRRAGHEGLRGPDRGDGHVLLEKEPFSASPPKSDR